MSVYQPKSRLTQVSGNNWNAETRCKVDPNEGLALESDSVSGALRTIIYNVTAGPGGTIDKVQNVNRQAGEERVKVIIKKDDEEKGDDVVSYD